MAKPAVTEIRKSLVEQLKKRGGESPFFLSLIEDFCNWESIERKMWAAMKKLKSGSPELEKLEKRALNASNRKMQILKQLDMKTSNVVGGDDEEM